MVNPELTQPFHADGGPTGILFVHGFTGSPASLREWAEHAAAAGHTVALPRLRGHATSWQELAVTSWRDWYEGVDAEYEALAARCERVFVAGISMGGTLALRLAQQHPEIAGLMLVNPALGTVNPVARFAGVVKDVVPSVPAIGNDVNREGVDEGAYDRTPLAAVDQLNQLFVEVKTLLDLVTCPIILFSSTVDHVVPSSSGDTIVRWVSATDITRVALPHSLHVATIDHDRHLIMEEAQAFLTRVVG